MRTVQTSLALAALLMATVPAWPSPAADAQALKQDAWSWIDAETDALAAANRTIWSLAETSLEEAQSSAALQAMLRENGFTVESGVADMPTAFVASYGSGAPVIGILAEFDALPGVSQAASPAPAPGPNPAAGHACGHSIYGVGSTGAALAVKQLIAAGRIKGTIKLYGTPAEETGIGKVYMLRDGYFKDDDAILKWHAGDLTKVEYTTTKALVNVKFRFKGTAAHASAQPFQGRSALDAVELMNTGVNYMREHVKQDARIHYVITDGGGQPNVVPPDAEVWYYIRANTFDDAIGYFDWIKEIAQGAAMMTRTELTVAVQSEVHDTLPVRAIAEAVHANLTAVGAPRWNETELAFARGTQAAFNKSSDARYALSPVIEPLPDSPEEGPASTDAGDISWFVPMGGVYMASYGYGLPIHAWPVVAATGTSIGTKSLVTAAKTLAGTAIDLYTDPDLLKRARADWEKVRGPRTWRTAIPEGQRAPKSVK